MSDAKTQIKRGEISGSHSDEYEGILAVNYFLGNLTNKMNRCRKLV